MRSTLRSGLALLFVAGLVSGCGRSGDLTEPLGSGSPSPDESEVTQQLSLYPEYIDEDVFGSEDPFPATAGESERSSALQVLSPIRPLHFWRHIESVSRRFEFAFSDTDSTGRPTRAVVTVNKVLGGSFNILISPPRDTVFERNVVRKPLEDLWVRKILLERVHVPDRAHRQWRIVGFSGVKVTSENAETRIVSMRIQGAGLDTVITDPLDIFRMRRVPHFQPDDSVTVTVTTLRNDDVVVLQHRRRHLAFHNNGDNTYTGVFRAAFLARVNHAGVNALSRGTLFDDQAPYDSQAWILPYAVRPTDLADHRP